MLAPNDKLGGNCPNWMAKARLWRLVLLQRSDGGWHLSDSLATSLEARRGKLDDTSAATGCCDDAPVADEDDEERGSSARAMLGEDCPLTCSREAVTECTPARLDRLANTPSKTAAPGSGRLARRLVCGEAGQ